MKNTLNDLNNYLFEELERLNDDETIKNNFENEIKRSKAIANLSQQVINIANTEVKAIAIFSENGIEKKICQIY